jgi:hypothetical protein
MPSTAFGRVSSWSGGLLGPVHVVDLGRSPQDGFTEYRGRLRQLGTSVNYVVP